MPQLAFCLFALTSDKVSVWPKLRPLRPTLRARYVSQAVDPPATRLDLAVNPVRGPKVYYPAGSKREPAANATLTSSYAPTFPEVPKMTFGMTLPASSDAHFRRLVFH